MPLPRGKALTCERHRFARTFEETSHLTRHQMSHAKRCDVLVLVVEKELEGLKKGSEVDERSGPHGLCQCQPLLSVSRHSSNVNNTHASSFLLRPLCLHTRASNCESLTGACLPDARVHASTYRGRYLAFACLKRNLVTFSHFEGTWRRREGRPRYPRKLVANDVLPPGLKRIDIGAAELCQHIKATTLLGCAILASPTLISTHISKKLLVPRLGKSCCL